MKTIIIALTFFLATTAYAETVDITIHWTSDDVIRDRDLAALYLKYQDEIIDNDQESPTYGELIPNPVSKKQTIINRLVVDLQEMVKGGAAKQADQYRIDAIEAAEINTAGITGE